MNVRCALHFPWLRVLLLGALLSGCPSGGGGNIGEDDPAAEGVDEPLSAGRGEGSVSVSYAKTAKGNWLRAEGAYKSESFLAAQKYYTYIRAKFPYSAYSLKSDLRIADCLFGRGRFLEAIDAYQNFVRLHPTHRDVPYAMYRTGASYFEQIPSDWFLLPPAHEKDQSAVRDAERALKAYVDRYPKDENMPEAKKLLADVRSRLAAHERYAADFYRKEDKPKARIGRLEILRTQFADVALDASLLLEMIEVRLELKEGAPAQELLHELEAKFPESSEVGKARKLLANAPVLLPKAEPSKADAPKAEPVQATP